MTPAIEVLGLRGQNSFSSFKGVDRSDKRFCVLMFFSLFFLPQLVELEQTSEQENDIIHRRVKTMNDTITDEVGFQWLHKLVNGKLKNLESPSLR